MAARLPVRQSIRLLSQPYLHTLIASGVEQQRQQQHGTARHSTATGNALADSKLLFVAVVVIVVAVVVAVRPKAHAHPEPGPEPVLRAWPWP